MNTALGHLPEKTEPINVLVKGVEVFRAGTYGKKGSADESFLKLAAKSYGSDGHEAPVTLDHAKHGPAHGWVKRAYAKGRSLFMDVELSAKMAEAVKNKAFKKRSIEFAPDADGKASPTIRALTFCGVKVPHVKGMADVVFELDEELVSIDFTEDEESSESDSDTIDFAELANSNPPKGAEHGTIVRQERVGDMLDHYHHAYVDESGNGFTSPPRKGYYMDAQSKELGSHVHLVKDGKIQESGKTKHTHYMPNLENKNVYYTDDSPEPENQVEEKPAEETSTYERKETSAVGDEATDKGAKTGGNSPAAGTSENSNFTEELATLRTTTTELVELVKSQGAELKGMRRERNEANAVVAFTETYSDCVAEGRLSPDPAMREEHKKKFLKAVRADENVKFEDGETSMADDYLDSLRKLPKTVKFTESAARRGAGFSGTGVSAGVASAPAIAANGSEIERMDVHAKAKAYAKDNSVTFTEALLAVSAEEGE